MIENKSILDEIGEGQEMPTEEINQEMPTGNKLNFDMGFLLTKTGEGSINEYQDHPLNFNKSNGMAQIIRGFTGLFGALDLAIIDIFVGVMQLGKERKKVDIIVD